MAPEASDASGDSKPLETPDVAAFIRANLRLGPVPSVPEIVAYAAHPGSGLRRLTDPRGEGAAPAPYWAYHWAGGSVLARHILAMPRLVRDRRVLDLGAGSGVVGIAAAKAGAREVAAADIDLNAVVALGLNAEANGVELEPVTGDPTAGPPPAVDVIFVGDLFYAADLAERVTAFLDRCLEAGIEVMIGDPYRAYLPLQRLRLVAEYAVADFGDVRGEATKLSGVFALEPLRQS